MSQKITRRTFLAVLSAAALLASGCGKQNTPERHALSRTDAASAAAQPAPTASSAAEPAAVPLEYTTPGDDFWIISENGDGTAVLVGYNGERDALAGSIALPAAVNGLTITSIANYSDDPSQFLFQNCNALTALKIPGSIRTIGNFSFSGCTGLETLVLEDGVEQINGNAFMNCSALTDVQLPDSLTTLENCVFGGCSALEAITLPQSVTALGPDIFTHCTALQKLALPEGLCRLEEYSFNTCSSLTSLYIPASVTYIGNFAFEDCDLLANIYYGGTEADWNKISISRPSADYTPYFSSSIIESTNFNDELDHIAIHCGSTAADL